MRIVLVTQYFWPEVGATQARLDAVSRELADMGHQVDVVTAMPSYPTGRIAPGYRGRLRLDERRGDVAVHRVWAYAATGMGLRRVASFLSFACTSLVAARGLPRPDVIVVESPPPSTMFPAAVAASWWRVPIVLYVADLWPDPATATSLQPRGAMAWLARSIMDRALARASMVTAATDGLASAIRARGIGADRVLMLTNGVDTVTFAPAPPDLSLRDELGLAPDDAVVLYAGTIGYVHGVDVAISAMALLAAERPDIVLVVVGDGSEAPRVRSLVRRAGLTNVRSVPPVQPDKLAAYWSIATIGLSTLRDVPVAEVTRPAKVLAAMASGVPVIYTGAGEGARIVVDMEAGWVVPPEDPAALASAMVNLVDDPTTRERLGRNGRRAAEETFAWPALVTTWFQQISTALEGRR